MSRNPPHDKEKSFNQEEGWDRYEALFNRSLFCVHIHDFEGNFIDANDAALNLLGFTREEIHSLNFGSLLSENQLPKALQELDEIIKTGRPSGISQYKLRAKDGRTVWVETEGSLIYQKGKPYAIQAIARDITDRKEAEEALRKSERRLLSLIKTVQAAIMVHGPDTSIRMSNATAERLLGLSEDQMLGKTDIDPEWRFFREDGTVLPIEEYPVNQVIATQAPVKNMTAGIHRPATEDIVWVFIHAEPVFDDQQNLSQIIVTFMDITESKRAAKERESLIYELQEALSAVKKLSGLLPICANCKKIRDDKGYWQQVEVYMHSHSDVSFTHGICPECADKLYPGFSGSDEPDPTENNDG